MADTVKKERSRERSLRITDDVMAKFNTIKQEMKWTQDTALGMLINAYELEQAKEIIPDREAEIKNFQAKVQELVSAFAHSLQLNMDAEDRVRAEFKTRLDIKERSIADYQRQLAEEQEKSGALAETQAKLAEAQDTVEDLKAELEALTKEIADLGSQTQKQLTDKDSIITMLSEKLTIAEKKAEGFDGLMERLDAVQDDLKSAQAAMKEQLHAHEVAMERAARAAERAQEQAVSSAKEDAHKEIKTVQDELLEAIKELRKAEQDHAQAIQQIEKDHRSEVKSLEQENTKLREQLADLRARLPENA